MFKRMFAGFSALAVTFLPNAGLALAVGPAEIEIQSFELVACNPDTIKISFNAFVGEEGANDVVEVKLNNTILFESDDVEDPDTIEFENLVINHGDNTIVATIYDNDSKDVVLASDEYAFNVECERSPQLYDDSNSHVNPNGSGGDSDCCPGSGGGGGGGSDSSSDESSTVTVAKKPAVKGATTKVSALSSLKPLNSVFRAVFGRDPNQQEWTYWANRYLTDKHNWGAILGAMQWHKLRGHTMGA